jgi:acetyl-CoA carboxylase biotin carboxyl carrier protein
MTDHATPRQHPGERVERSRKALGLVAGGDQDDGFESSRVGGASYCPRRRRHGSGARMTAIEAHISGVVWRIGCAVGDEITEGDTVVVLESMKMEMPVESDVSGTVKAILCRKGDKVNEGDPLIELE